MPLDENQTPITDYFGFDLGDGESAVAWARANSRNEPQVLELCGRKSLLTALGRHRQMGVLIGEQAYLADPSELDVRFKSRFLTDEAYAAPRIVAFAREALKQLWQSGKLNAIEEAAFFVGCPSGWNEEERDRYRQLFEQAGCKNVTIVSESRAAFMFAREAGEIGMPQSDLEMPALIVDAGSSTTDFTFIDQLRVRRVFDFGLTRLGGGLIDRMLLELNLERSPARGQLRAVLDKCPQYAARCELEARKVKEMYFRQLDHAAQGEFCVPCESSVKIYYQDPPLTLDIGCTRRDMRAILERELPELDGKSYLQAYRDSLKQARQQIAGTRLGVILLTGGASRMDFIEKIAREVFPDAQIVHGAEPEFSIARGLCYALRIDTKTAAFERAVERLIESDAVEKLVLNALPALFEPVSSVIAAQLTQVSAVEAFRRWKTGELKTLDEMNGEIRFLIEQSLREGELRVALGPVTTRWVDELRPALERLTDPICREYDLPVTSLRLPSTLELNAGALPLDTGKMVDLSLLQAVVDVTVASIVAAILGGSGMALLMAGPVGLVVSFAIGFVASHLGTSFAKKRLGQVRLPAFVRMLFTTGAFRRRLDGLHDDLQAAIRTQLMRSLDPPDEAVSHMIGAVSHCVEDQLRQLAEQARLLIH